MRFIFIILFIPLLVLGQAGGDNKSADELETEFNKTAKELSSPLKDSFITEMLGTHAKGVIEKTLKENPFSKMSKAQVKSLTESLLNNQKIGSILAKNPKALDFLVSWLHDKEAMPKALSVVNKPKKVKIFGYIAIAVFIISFILNLVNSGKGIIKRIFSKILIFVGATAVNLTAFFLMFQEEMTPTLRIAKNIIF